MVSNKQRWFHRRIIQPLLANFDEVFYQLSREYYQSIVHKKFKVSLSDLICWTRFGGEMGVTATWAPKDLVPQNRIKNIDHWVEIFRPEPP